MNTDIVIRLADPDDAKALLAIYAPYVKNTPITFEYEVPSEEEFRSRIENTLEKYPYLVAEIEQKPVGYAYASAFKGRAAYDWSVETSIYVEQSWRGCGIGSTLYQVLEKWLARQNIINLNACITFPNPASVRFHKGFGYRTVAHFNKCGYKLGAWHDVIWMTKTLSRPKNPPEPVVWMNDFVPRIPKSQPVPVPAPEPASVSAPTSIPEPAATSEPTPAPAPVSAPTSAPVPAPVPASESASATSPAPEPASESASATSPSPEPAVTSDPTSAPMPEPDEKHAPVPDSTSAEETAAPIPGGETPAAEIPSETANEIPSETAESAQIIS